MRIVYFDLDTMRSDHLGCNGYHRNTTPNIDRIARDGVTFTRAYCADSPCVPSRANLISGRFGVHNGVVTHWGPGCDFRGVRRDAPLLTRHLREHGYRTASFSCFPDRHDANWFCGGWTEMHNPTLKRGNETADEINAAVLPWLEQHGRDEDYFLHIHYWDPHRDFRIDQEWADIFADDAPPDWPDEEAIASHQANYGPFTASELHPFSADGRSRAPTMPDQIASRTDFKRLVDAYDGAVRFMDTEIGRVLDTLVEIGVLDDTAIIFSSDHGEALGEHGVYADHVCADEAVHHIPMVIRWPGGARDTSYDGLMYNVDLHPTLCELTGIPVPSGWDGESVADAIRGDAWEGRPHLVWGHALYSCQRAVRTPEWLFVRTYHPGLHPFDDVALHDMHHDRQQARNVAATETRVMADLDHIMQQWTHEKLARPGSDGDPMLDVLRDGPYRYVPLDRWLDRLRHRGRTADAQQILDRLQPSH